MIRISLPMVASLVFLVIGALSFIVAFFNRRLPGSYLVSFWAGVIFGIISASIAAGYYLGEIDIVVR